MGILSSILGMAKGGGALGGGMGRRPPGEDWEYDEGNKGMDVLGSILSSVGGGGILGGIGDYLVRRNRGRYKRKPGIFGEAKEGEE